MTKSKQAGGRQGGSLPLSVAVPFASPVPHHPRLLCSPRTQSRQSRPEGHEGLTRDKGRVQHHPSSPSRLQEACIFPKSFDSYQHNIYHLLILPVLCTLQRALRALSRSQSSQPHTLQMTKLGSE